MSQDAQATEPLAISEQLWDDTIARIEVLKRRLHRACNALRLLREVERISGDDFATVMRSILQDE